VISNRVLFNFSKVCHIDSFGTNEFAFGMAINDKDEIFACMRNELLVRKFVLDPQK
jgi:hypothetical protein